MKRMKISRLIVIFASLLSFSCVTLGQQVPSPADTPKQSNATPPQPEISDNGDVALGAPIEFGRLDYPKQALATHVQGAVVLKLLVGKNGKVKNASAVIGDPLLADAAVRATRKWVYGSYDVDGKATEATTTVTIHFKISDDGQPNVSATYPPPKSFGSSEIVKIGKGVTPPKVIFAPDPEYSEQARLDRYQAVCVLGLIVGPDGRPYDIRVKRAIGQGLDIKDVEAVRRWKFDPAMKDGKAVAVAINIEVTFRLR